MKFLFLIACIVCAISLSMFSMIIATGRIPFRSKDAQVETAEKSTAEKGEKPAGLVGQKETVDDLIIALKKEKQAYEKKAGELAAREQALSNEQEVVTMLKSELEKSRTSLDAKLVETDAAEQVNLKRLSTVYSKMEAESASTLLREMTSDRAAKILNLIPERQAAAILNASIGVGTNGTKSAADWSDVIRRMKQEKVKKGP
jgi:flagellar motility protein MotE (MotC chaperone)